MIVARESSSIDPQSGLETRAKSAGSPLVRPKVLARTNSQIGHEENPANSTELLNELGLRNYVSSLANSGSPVHSTLLTGPTAVPEPASGLPELFWKLVERRIHAATFSYLEGGRVHEDIVRVTPHGYSLVRG